MSHLALGGIWVLNQDRGDLPGAAPGTDQSEPAGRRGRGVTGRIGGGRRGRGYGGDGQPQREDDMARRQAIMNYVRSATESSKQLTLVVHETSVTITDADGRVQVVQTDKQIDSRAENGLIRLSTKSHWDGATLVSEVDIDSGPKIVRSYALSPGGTELRLTTTVDGHPPVNLIRFYERPVESR